MQGFRKIAGEQGIKGLFRGWVPTAIGYSAQGAFKVRGQQGAAPRSAQLPRPARSRNRQRSSPPPAPLCSLCPCSSVCTSTSRSEPRSRAACTPASAPDSSWGELRGPEPGSSLRA